MKHSRCIHSGDFPRWGLNCSLVKKAQQCLHFLHRLWSACLSPKILTSFCLWTTERIHTCCMLLLYGNCLSADQKALQWVVMTAQHITSTQLPAIKDLYHKHCLRKGLRISRDPTHPNRGMFSSCPLGDTTSVSVLALLGSETTSSPKPAVTHLDLATTEIYLPSTSSLPCLLILLILFR